MKNWILSLIVLGTSILIGQAQITSLSGQRYLEELQPGKAKLIFQVQLKSNPHDISACLGLGNTFIALDSTDSAKTMFRKVLSINPDNYYALIGLGQIAWLANDREGESTYFERARRANKNNPEVYRAIAESCLNQRKQDTVTALVYLKQGLDLYQKNAGLHISMGNLELIKKNYGAAANAYDRAIFFDPKSSIAYRKKGIILFLSRSYRQALEDYNKSLAIDPEQILVYKNLGDLFYSIAKYAEAEKAYQTYMERAEVTLEDRERFALTLFFNKKYKDAETQLEQLLKVSDTESVLLRIRGYIAFETGEYAKGVDYMNQFFKLHNPRKVIAMDYSYYAKLLQKTGQELEAINSYKKAIALEPAKIENYEELARLATKNKMHLEAISCYKMMIELGADKRVNNFLIGKEYYFEGERLRAKFDSLKQLQKSKQVLFNDSSSIRKAIISLYINADSAMATVTRLNPDYAGSYIWKGRIQSILDPGGLTTVAKDEYQKALVILEKSETANNQKSIVECYRYLGSYYYLTYERFYKSDKKLAGEMRSKMIECFTKILKLDPSDVQAKDVLSKLK
jgi:tetratricopeptide (TPR) repeat protein